MRPAGGWKTACIGHLLLDAVSLHGEPGQLRGQVPVRRDVEGLRGEAGRGGARTRTSAPVQLLYRSLKILF